MEELANQRNIPALSHPYDTELQKPGLVAPSLIQQPKLLSSLLIGPNAVVQARKRVFRFQPSKRNEDYPCQT